MRKYLSTLHRQSPHHKKRFALLASSTITLFIFGIWSLATFGVDKNIVSEVSNEVGPFQSLRLNLASSIVALRDSFEELKSGFQSVDFEAGYQEMRDRALDTYGR